ncbi:MAG: DUF3791 domain-containing protein [Bacteroides sp.]|nr:DUF3791 domain-containing protein [Bacteroides sp.]MBD5360170.1 DUF3791 domain-containing protein [Bacteroides sp.]MBD5361626.1 DUF3791 domain-containing protein [Bacteroides sp.]MBD5363800.1 DUF3791 domain-containing protein [Bacteroides sp.]MDE6034133.1 DUF3791 domain-containing protein [Muribaculaceae bacterium]
MKYPLQHIIEYTIALIADFAKKYNLTERQAFNYLRIHHGIDFIEENYGVIHTFDFKEAVDSLAMYCNRNGGQL